MARPKNPPIPRRYGRPYLDALSDDRVLQLADRHDLAVKLEDAFRLWAFRTAYDKALHDVRPPWLRFARALLISARRKVHAALVAKWKAAYARELLADARPNRQRANKTALAEIVLQARDAAEADRQADDDEIAAASAPILRLGPGGDYVRDVTAAALAGGFTERERQQIAQGIDEARAERVALVETEAAR